MASPDRAAAWIAAVTGLVLIIPSVTAIVLLWDRFEEGEDLDKGIIDFRQDLPVYEVVWEHRQADEGSVLVEDGSQEAEVALNVTGMLATVTVDFPSCDDTFDPNLRQSAAQLSWRLASDLPDFAAQEGTFLCADVPDEMTFHALNGTGGEAPHPDIGSVEARKADADAALAAGLAGANRTATYTLTLSWERTAGPLDGLPGAPVAPQISAQARLTAHVWEATARTDAPMEVPK